VPFPGYDATGVGKLLQEGDPDGTVWRPGETDVSIRPGWFHHAAEDDEVRDAANLLDLYFTSVGRNSKLLLNVPPTPEGLLHAIDLRHRAEFGALRVRVFGRDGAAGAARRVEDSGRTVVLEFPAPVTFDVIRMEEAIEEGQVVSAYRVEAKVGKAWRTVARGTTIGHRKLDRIASIAATGLRMVIGGALDTPRIARIGLHKS
jgi:alpha-L-fucosidase